MRIDHSPVLLAFCLAAVLSAQAPAPQANENTILRMANQIRKQIVTLPEYGLFDDLRFSIKGSEVILRGKASRPTLKSSAEQVAKRVEGVQKVTNEIEVLPFSRFDDETRARVYLAIYRHPSLDRYNPNRGTPLFSSLASRIGGITNDPPPGFHPIHIIVKNGQVTLEGVVDNASDSTLAELQANSVSGVFSVTNNLQIANSHMMELMGDKAKPKK